MSEPIVAWRVTRLMDKPERHEFARETAHCYFDAKGRRQSKTTSWEQFYATEAEAVAVIAANKARAANQDRADRIRRAAPELLEALQQLMSAASLSAAQGVPFAIDSPGIVAARAAITKATGETP